MSSIKIEPAVPAAPRSDSYICTDTRLMGGTRIAGIAVSIRCHTGSPTDPSDSVSRTPLRSCTTIPRNISGYSSFGCTQTLRLVAFSGIPIVVASELA